jgi:biotin operon repressor
MTRSDRRFAMVLLIQRKRRVRALGLAQAFEVSERTIECDMAALSESGVPIVALPGAGYELVEGYYAEPRSGCEGGIVLALHLNVAPNNRVLHIETVCHVTERTQPPRRRARGQHPSNSWPRTRPRSRPWPISCAR